MSAQPLTVAFLRSSEYYEECVEREVALRMSNPEEVQRAWDELVIEQDARIHALGKLLARSGSDLAAFAFYAAAKEALGDHFEKQVRKENPR